MNEHLSTLLLAPMTSNKRKYPTRVKVNYEGKVGMIVLDQIRTIDKKRIVNVGGEISTKEIFELKLVLKKPTLNNKTGENNRHDSMPPFGLHRACHSRY